MKIELKNVKYAAFNSQETDCFEATIYLDGKRACRVSNEGHGGPHLFESLAVQQQIDAYAKTLPEIDVSYLYSDGAHHTMAQDAELLISGLVERWLQKKQCANKVMYRAPGQTYGEDQWHVVKGNFTPEIRASLVAKHGEGTDFFNDQFVD